MNILNRLRRQPRWRLITAGVVVLALVGGVTAVNLWPAFTMEATPSAAPTATPTPAPEPVVLLPTANVAATFEGWSQDNADTASIFAAEAGDAANGTIGLRIDSTNPAENTIRRALSQVVAVSPSTTYTLAASVKTAGQKSVTPGISIIMGGSGQDRYDFKAVNASWQEQTWTYKTAADEMSMPISILSAAPTAGVSLDSVTMTAANSNENLLANPSFERFTAPTRITNTSLLLNTGEAAIGVSWKIPGAAWTITDEAGATVDQGTVDLQPGLAVVSLQHLDPGYYSIAISNNDNTDDRLDTSFAILDPVATNASPTDERFGVGVHLTPAYFNSGSIVAQLGIASVRTDAKWDGAETTLGKYSFPTNDDAMIQDYANAGVSFLPISDYANKLYDGGKTPSSPNALAAYGAFTSEMVEHYDSAAVEIYNEFNIPRMNTSACGTTAACYLPLLQSAAASVKAEHPAALIVGPAIAHQDDAWLTALYAAGGLDSLDAVSFHPYDYSFESGPEFIEASLQQAVSRIKEYNGDVSKPIWITELGWSTASFSEQDQADNLVRTQTIAFANGVEKFFWYDLVNDTADASDHEGNFGLLRQVTDEVPAFAPKPSAVAEAVMIRLLNGKPFSSRDALDSTSVYSYVFGANLNATRVAWATTPTTAMYAANGNITMTDQFGAMSTLVPVDGLITVELTGHPVYLEGPITNPI
ncbi:glycosyl hydrolase [Cryobacterium gelidum]|uniref:Asl1-like glycosyl hydrolase catalytic domain-containing protein n=1 Tax=Cryobacterium gelidum TaxID=1259164 RepID=A0A4R9AUW7_9MICO|nr:glycosyl hydrolase [Cryobacterium gelidum]TFD70249.1 hypothetical protein E3T50_10285 [Cryobacterium gelidum]